MPQDVKGPDRLAWIVVLLVQSVPYATSLRVSLGAARARALALASRPRGLGAIGSYLLTAAFRSAPASLVAPFECSALLWGIAIDRVVWHVLPSMRSGTSGPAPEPCHHNSHGSGARGKAECRADRRQWKTSLANKRKTHHEHRRYPWTIYLARVVDD